MKPITEDLWRLGPFEFVGGPADGETLDWIADGILWVDVPVFARGRLSRVRYEVHLEDKTLR